MADLKTVSVNGVNPADLLIAAGDGPTLIVNTDLTNILYLSHDITVVPGDQRHNTTLSPQSFVVFNGEDDVYAVSPPGTIIQVQVIPGGVSYFQSGITSGGLVVNSKGLFLYNGNPATGTLMFSIVPLAGTDNYGNPYLVGMDVGQVPPLVHIYSKPAVGGVIEFVTEANIEKVASNIVGEIANQGGPTHRFLQMLLDGPEITTVSHDDWVQFQLNSANEDTTSFANMGFVYIPTSGGSASLMAFMDGSGFNIAAGSITAKNPASGTSTSNPATPEPWHSLGALGGTSGYTVQRAQYKMMPTGEVFFDINLAATSTAAAGTYAFANTLPAAYIPSLSRSYPLGFNGPWQASGLLFPSLRIGTTGTVQVTIPALVTNTILSAGQLMVL